MPQGQASMQFLTPIWKANFHNGTQNCAEIYSLNNYLGVGNYLISCYPS